jgi:hypothetical protein
MFQIMTWVMSRGASTPAQQQAQRDENRHSNICREPRNLHPNLELRQSRANYIARSADDPSNLVIDRVAMVAIIRRTCTIENREHLWRARYYSGLQEQEQGTTTSEL